MNSMVIYKKPHEIVPKKIKTDDERHKGGISALLYGCQQGNVDIVQRILRVKPKSILEKDRSGKTALHYCCISDNIVSSQAADLLVMAAPDLVDKKDNDGFTPLHLAVIAGNLSLVTFLLANKADVTALDNEKHSVVHWASVCGETAALRAVLEAGANVSTPDIHGGYPLHYAAQMCGDEKNSTLGLEVLHILLTHKQIDVTVEDNEHRQPLLWASSAGSSKAILALARAGASVEATDKDGLTALHCAASRGHTECIDTLINLCGATVDFIDNNGCTALHYAVTLGHADATTLLLTLGADPNRQDRKGRTPAHCGCAKGQLETVKLLANHKANLWLKNIKGDFPLHEAASSGRRELVKWLLDGRPSQVNAKNNNGRTSLHIAALNDNADMCKILIDIGADVNPLVKTSRNIFMTPLDCALQRGFRSTAKFLQLHGGVPASRMIEIRRKNSSGGLSLQIRDDVTFCTDSSSESGEKERSPNFKNKRKKRKESKQRFAYKYERVKNWRTEDSETEAEKEEIGSEKDILIYANEVNINDTNGNIRIKQNGKIVVETNDTKEKGNRPTSSKNVKEFVIVDEKNDLGIVVDDTTKKEEQTMLSKSYGENENKSEDISINGNCDFKNLIVEASIHSPPTTGKVKDLGIEINGNKEEIQEVINKEISTEVTLEENKKDDEGQNSKSNNTQIKEQDLKENKNTDGDTNLEPLNQEEDKVVQNISEKTEETLLESEKRLLENFCKDLDKENEIKSEVEVNSHFEKEIESVDTKEIPEEQKHQARNEIITENENINKETDEASKSNNVKRKKPKLQRSKSQLESFSNISDSTTSVEDIDDGSAHRSFKIIGKQPAIDKRDSKIRLKKERSRSEESKQIMTKKSKIPMLKQYSKSDKNLNNNLVDKLDSAVPSLPDIHSKSSTQGTQKTSTRSASNMSAPIFTSAYSDHEHESPSEQDTMKLSSASRKKRFRKKMRSREAKSAGGSGYDSSNLIDSGFEPSPRSNRLPKWKNMSNRSCNMTSVTQTIQSNIRRYHLERKIFQHLLELKRLQIRSGQHNESVLVKRAVDAYHQSCAATVGAGRYFSNDYTFKSFEKFLYNSLRKIQRNGAENLTGLPESTKNPLLCTQSTYRCDHAVHAYTGIPCAAYLPKMDHHTIPKIGFDCKPQGFLPKINASKNTVTLQLCHGNDKQIISLPAERLDQNKRYYVTFTVRGQHEKSIEHNAEDDDQNSGHRHSKSI